MTKNGNQSSRRKFLGDSSKIIAAGALTSAATLPNTSLARSANVGGTDTIKIGLVGCGGRGTGAAIHAMNTQSGNVELRAMGDAFENRLQGSLEACERQHKDKVKVTEDSIHVGFDAFERVIDSDIDLVILATPPGFRPLHFEKAIAADKHVFMEKPVAVDAPGVRRVLKSTELAKQKGLAVQVGLQRRHERAYRETIARIQDGIIGDIVLARAYWNSQGVWVRPRQENQTELEYQMRNWYYFNWLCGDHIDEQHIHNIDVINWLMNDYPVTAQGQGGRQVRTGIDTGQIYDHHFVEFTYGNGTKMFSQCRHIPDCWNSVSEYCHGTRGSANIGAGRIFDSAGKEIFRTDGSRDGHQQEHHDLFADLRNGIIPNEGEYGAKSTMTSIFGRMATYSGKEIRWEDAIESNISLANVDELKTLKDEAPLQPNAEGRYKVPMPGADWQEILDWKPGRRRN